MFDDLSLEEARALKIELRAAWLKLMQGLTVAEIRYGEMGRKFAPASVEACERAMNALNARIATLAGTGGAIFPVGR